MESGRRVSEGVCVSVRVFVWWDGRSNERRDADADGTREWV